VEHDKNVLIADRPQNFANAVSRALNNKVLRKQLGAAGRVLVERKYSWEVIGDRLERAYLCAQNRLACDRHVLALPSATI
jgi:glycosyltransferase involved in cell wall biosynthesis